MHVAACVFDNYIGYIVGVPLELDLDTFMFFLAQSQIQRQVSDVL